ncbi:MAG: hypothetical protein ACRCXQ_05975 [Vagococcus fluvialis]
MPIGNPQLAELLKKQLQDEKVEQVEVQENTIESVEAINEEEVTEKPTEAVETTSIELPSLKKQENRKPYPFTLKPSVRKKITKLANENGYTSASAFVNDVFENL